MANEIWRLPYTAAQLQSVVTNQVPRINPTNKHWERWDIATDAWVDTGILADGSVIYGSVSLSSVWVEDVTNGWWTQDIVIPDATATSVIDLRFSPAQLKQLAEDGLVCTPIAGNDNGAITVYAIGAEPTMPMTVDYTMQYGTAGPAAVYATQTPSYARSGVIYDKNLDAPYESVEEEEEE